MTTLLIILLVIVTIYFMTRRRGHETNSQINSETRVESKRVFLDPMINLPTPKGNYTEDGIELLWVDFGIEEDSKEYDEYWKDEGKTKKENYYYGKKIYEEKFGEIVGSPLKNVIKNISELYENEYYDNDIDSLMVQSVIKRMGGEYQWWNLCFYGGKHMVSTGNGKEEVEEEGYEKYFRRAICKPREIITDEELIDFHTNYTEEIHLLTQKETRLIEVNKFKRIINKEFCSPLKEEKYNKDTKTWIDFDINGVFLRVRGLMINKSNPFPQYVWNLIGGNPFDGIYRICRDYMKWKGTYKVSKLVFDNVVKWENGEIFKEGEPLKEYEQPLWVNWNKVGKDFLSLKTKLKKENKGGLNWLRDGVGGYIKERKEFYNLFGRDSIFKISDDLISKFQNI